MSLQSFLSNDKQRKHSITHLLNRTVTVLWMRHHFHPPMPEPLHCVCPFLPVHPKMSFPGSSMTRPRFPSNTVLPRPPSHILLLSRLPPCPSCTAGGCGCATRQPQSFFRFPAKLLHRDAFSLSECSHLAGAFPAMRISTLQRHRCRAEARMVHPCFIRQLAKIKQMACVSMDGME